jgi:hypothetical protein
MNVKEQQLCDPGACFDALQPQWTYGAEDELTRKETSFARCVSYFYAQLYLFCVFPTRQLLKILARAIYHHC